MKQRTHRLIIPILLHLLGCAPGGAPQAVLNNAEGNSKTEAEAGTTSDISPDAGTPLGERPQPEVDEQGVIKAAVDPNPLTQTENKYLASIDVKTSCTQTSYDVTSQTPNFVVTCSALKSDGQPFDPKDLPIQVKWTFFHSYGNSDYLPTIIETGMLGKVSYKFNLRADRPFQFMMADTGFYRLILTDAKDASSTRIVLPETPAKITGEGCGKADRLSLSSNYFLIENYSQVNRIGGNDRLGFLVGIGASLTTNTDSNAYVIQDKGRVTDKGANGNALVFGTGQYTSAKKTGFILAEKTAKITVPVKEVIFYFNTPLQFCD